jgi:hypothetical protein
MSAVGVRETSLLAPRRSLGIGGALVVALWLLGILVVEAVGDSPDSGEAQALLRYFGEDEMSIYVGSLLFILGSVLFIWWVSLLRSLVAPRVAGSWLPSALFGSGIAMAVLSIGFVAPQLGAAFAANDDEAQLTPAAAQALWWVGDGSFVATAYAGASLVILTAIVAYRFKLLPVWALALLAVAALLMLIPGINWLGVVFGIPIAVLLIGFFFRSGGEALGESGARTSSQTGLQ